jgi:hypothetical protein
MYDNVRHGGDPHQPYDQPHFTPVDQTEIFRETTTLEE